MLYTIKRWSVLNSQQNWCAASRCTEPVVPAVDLHYSMAWFCQKCHRKPPLYSTVKSQHLSLFGHVANMDADCGGGCEPNTHWAPTRVLKKPPGNWALPMTCPSWTWGCWRQEMQPRIDLSGGCWLHIVLHTLTGACIADLGWTLDFIISSLTHVLIVHCKVTASYWKASLYLVWWHVIKCNWTLCAGE